VLHLSTGPHLASDKMAPPNRTWRPEGIRRVPRIVTPHNSPQARIADDNVPGSALCSRTHAGKGACVVHVTEVGRAMPFPCEFLQTFKWIAECCATPWLAQTRVRCHHHGITGVHNILYSDLCKTTIRARPDFLWVHSSEISSSSTERSRRSTRPFQRRTWGWPGLLECRLRRGTRLESGRGHR
jgi:hypothetical protein